MLFKLSGIVSISIYTEVEAETLEEALIIVKNREIEKSDYRPEHQVKRVWVVDDYDGEPTNIEVDP